MSKYNFNSGYSEKDGKVIRKENLEGIYLGALQGEFDEAIEYLKDKKKNFLKADGYWAKNYHRIYLGTDTNCDGENTLYIMGDRVVIGEELDEYNKEQEKRKVERESYQFQQYKDLKRKFEGI